MKILAVDSSAIPASAAVWEDGRLLGEFYSNTRQTHSQTLLPMVENLLKCTQTALNEIDLFAVSAGPGSFTGVRIGVACVKGLAMPEDKPCAGVSTLEAIAWNLAHLRGTICAVMDARCQQVYNAVFEADGESLRRLTPDRAIAIKDLAQEASGWEAPIYLVGDGAKLCHGSPEFSQLGAKLPPEHLLYQRASGVIAAALHTQPVSCAQLAPVYLRMPQAERELRRKGAPRPLDPGQGL